MLTSVAGWCFRHRIVVVMMWLAILGSGVVASLTVFSNLAVTTTKSHPTESSHGSQLLERGQPDGDQLMAVVDQVSADSPEIRSAVQRAALDIRAMSRVASVRTAYDTDAPPGGSPLMTGDHRAVGQPAPTAQRRRVALHAALLH